MADVGRPTIIDKEVIDKLELVFALDGTDLEACSYANIAPATLYNYQNKNPDFLERKQMLKERPFIKARQTVVKALDNPSDAQWYLERKKKHEFSSKTEQDINLSGGISLTQLFDQAKKNEN